MIRIWGPAILSSIGCIGLFSVPNWSQQFTLYAALYGALFGVALLAAALNRKRDLTSREWIVFWAAALFGRGLLVFHDASLSDDIFRYLWDGHILLSGLNPFRYAPSDPALVGLHTAFWGLINNPHLPTIYPPLLQLVFAGLTLLSSDVVLMKLGLLCFEIGGLWFLFLALPSKHRTFWFPLYLLNPLMILEVSGNGHADAVGVFLICLALYFSSRHRAFGAAISLTLAGLVKFLPWLAIPLFLRRLKLKWLLLPLLVAVFYLPFSLGGVNPLGSLETYTLKWRANDFLFSFIHGNQEVTEASLATAKKIVVGMVGLVWILLVLRKVDWPTLFLWVLGTFFLLSPVMHPWYLLWLLPVAVQQRSLGFVLWSLTIVLAYEPLARFQATGIWTENLSFKWIEYAPVLLLLALEIGWKWQRNRGNGTQAA